MDISLWSNAYSLFIACDEGNEGVRGLPGRGWKQVVQNIQMYNFPDF